MKELVYEPVMWAEMSPDMDDAPPCPLWHCRAEGDMDSDCLETVELSAKHFPPGTKIIVSQPCCPECGQIVELCRGDDACSFNWDEWAEAQFS